MQLNWPAMLSDFQGGNTDYTIRVQSGSSSSSNSLPNLKRLTLQGRVELGMHQHKAFINLLK